MALDKKAKDKGQRSKGKKIRIGVIRFPRISNYTDFDPLEAEPDVDLNYIEKADELVGLDILILPGSKSTIGDLRFLEKQGMFEPVRTFGGPVIGICGGYQMLGNRILDPHGIESSTVEAEGLGLLDAETVLLPHKETHQAEGSLLQGATLIAPDCTECISGYEIHMGQTTLGPSARPFAELTRRSGEKDTVSDGAVSIDGRVFGTYLHGIFDNRNFRAAFLNRIRKDKGLPTISPDNVAADPFDLLAEHLERYLDMEQLLRICGIESTGE